MTPPKPPRKSYMMKSTPTSPFDIQPTYEDPDASMPAVTDGSWSAAEFKPVPRPRIKSQANAQSDTNGTVDPVDKTSNTTSAVSSQHNEYPADSKTPQRVGPPPRPPSTKSLTSSKTTAAVDGDSQRTSSNTESSVKPPAVSTRPKHGPPPPPPPKRPPPPSIYYHMPLSAMAAKSLSLTEDSQQSAVSSMQQTPVSAYSEEAVPLIGTYGGTTTDSANRPAVPPRPSLPSLPRSASECETSPVQTRPPPPQFNPPPPPPPSQGTYQEAVYSEIEYHSYLAVLPGEEDEMDINGMLRWLKRVSQPDYMSPSVYGLSIEEEMGSFNQRATNLSKALRLYNLLMMKRNKSLRNIIAEFSSISNSLDKMQKKVKTMGIAGGTTGAVGGVTAVVGIALAPVTMGASLIATAVGAGIVATAGGMGAHAAKAKNKVVNRKTVEKLVHDYKENIVDLEQCLDFILSGMNELRRYDAARLQRAGAQPDTLRMAHLSQSVLKNNMNNEKKTSVSHTFGMSSERLLLAFANELDQYFTENDGQKLKKSTKSKFSGRVRLLAENLQDELDHLNRMWEMFS